MIERVTRVHLLPKDEPIFSEQAYVIEIEDEASGEYIVVSEQRDAELKPGTLGIDIDDWPRLRKAINRMVKSARKET